MGKKFTSFEKLPGFLDHVVLDVPDDRRAYAIALEYDPAGEIEVQETQECCILEIKLKLFKNGFLCDFVILLAIRFLGVSLVPVQVRNFLVQLDCLASDDERDSSPEFFVSVGVVGPSIHIDAEGEGLNRIFKFVANGD